MYRSLSELKTESMVNRKTVISGKKIEKNTKQYFFEKTDRKN